MKILLSILILIPTIGLSQSIRSFADSSDLIIEGIVLKIEDIEFVNGFNQVATVEVKRVFKGEIATNRLRIFSEDKLFHSTIRYELGQHFISFLILKDSIAQTIHNHNGKFDFGSEISQTFSEFLMEYLNSKSNTELLEIDLDYIKRGPEFLNLAMDIIQEQNVLSDKQKKEIIENAIQNIDSLLEKLSKNEMNRYYDICFKINDYQFLLTIAENRKQKRQVESFIATSLLSKNSQLITTHALANICKITTKSKRKKRKLYEDYKQYEIYYSSEEDSIDERLKTTIEKFKKLAPTKPKKTWGETY